jgi:hypothetical protein
MTVETDSWPPPFSVASHAVVLIGPHLSGARGRIIPRAAHATLIARAGRPHARPFFGLSDGPSLSGKPRPSFGCRAQTRRERTRRGPSRRRCELFPQEAAN